MRRGVIAMRALMTTGGGDVVGVVAIDTRRTVVKGVSANNMVGTTNWGLTEIVMLLQEIWIALLMTGMMLLCRSLQWISILVMLTVMPRKVPAMQTLFRRVLLILLGLGMDRRAACVHAVAVAVGAAVRGLMEQLPPIQNLRSSRTRRIHDKLTVLMEMLLMVLVWLLFMVLIIMATERLLVIRAPPKQIPTAAGDVVVNRLGRRGRDGRGTFPSDHAIHHIVIVVILSIDPEMDFPDLRQIWLLRWWMARM